MFHKFCEGTFLLYILIQLSTEQPETTQNNVDNIIIVLRAIVGGVTKVLEFLITI